MTKGSKAGHVVFPGPPLTGCFETDDRLVDNNIGVSCRLQMVFDFDTAASTAVLTRSGSDKTFEVDCDTGELFCEKVPSPSVHSTIFKRFFVRADPPLMDPLDVGVSFVGRASDPCVTGSPNLKAVGSMGYNLAHRQFVWNIDTDFFPAWEAYLQIDGGPPKTLFTFLPSPSSTPFRLLAPGAFNDNQGIVPF